MLRKIAIALTLVLFATGAAQAQVPLGLELSGGAAFPTKDFGDAALKTGAGFEFTATLRVLPHMHVYGGWDWHSFVMDRAFYGTKFDVEDTGYAFGLMFRHPLVRDNSGWIRAGGIYNHIEIENDAGDIVADSGHELGWEVGGGMFIPLTQNLALTPGVRYRALSAEVTPAQTVRPVDLNYVTAQLGLAWTFGAPRGVAARTR
jgi:hypothetical protein